MELMPKINPNGWDEMFSSKGVRNSYRQVLQTLQSLSKDRLELKQKQAAEFFMSQGITFTVYSDDNQGIERIFPFDIIPKTESTQSIFRGHLQRAAYCKRRNHTCLTNCFLPTLYSRSSRN